MQHQDLQLKSAAVQEHITHCLARASALCAKLDHFALKITFSLKSAH